MRIATIIIVLLLAACAAPEAPAPDKDAGTVLQELKARAEEAPEQYSKELLEKIEQAESPTADKAERPDYLPKAMFKNLPQMPGDFYAVRSMVHSNILKDIDEIAPEYWLQPEWFPGFEGRAVPTLQNPPKNRWGAWGVAIYPPETVAGIRPGETLETVFWLTSGYLVETFQGFKVEPKFPNSASITGAREMASGTDKVIQEPSEVRKYFEVEIEPEMFILEPNFPIWQVNGTRRIKVRITAAEDTPPGDYVVAVDNVAPSQEQEAAWQKQYLNRYASGKYVKLDRPFYQAFLTVSE